MLQDFNKREKTIKKICVARGEDLSDLARRSIRKELAFLGYLPNDVKKALGMQKEEDK